jgi:hypothetical protein
MNDWAAEMMERHGMQRIQQGTAKGSPLLAGNLEKPRVDFDLLNWLPPADMRPQ